jgi:hypothetical protein
MKIVLSSLCTAIVATTLVGCSTPRLADTPLMVVQCGVPAMSAPAGPALVGQSYGLTMTPLPLNSVQFTSVEASQSIAVQNLYAERASTDVVQLTVRLVSCLDAPISVRVRTSFMRSNTSPAEEPSAWKTVHVEPRATALYRENSTSREAAAYLVEIAR